VVPNASRATTHRSTHTVRRPEGWRLRPFPPFWFPVFKRTKSSLVQNLAFVVDFRVIPRPTPLHFHRFFQADGDRFGALTPSAPSCRWPISFFFPWISGLSSPSSACDALEFVLGWPFRLWRLPLQLAALKTKGLCSVTVESSVAPREATRSSFLSLPDLAGPVFCLGTIICVTPFRFGSINVF